MFSKQGEAGKHAFLFMFYLHSEKIPTIEDGEMNADMVPSQCPNPNFAKAKLIDHIKNF